MVDCKHLKFDGNFHVNRLTNESGEVNGYMMDIQVRCANCKVPFKFLGLPIGVSPKTPRLSADEFEMRAPIEPSVAHVLAESTLEAYKLKVIK